jgi:hypothetical protein
MIRSKPNCIIYYASVGQGIFENSNELSIHTGVNKLQLGNESYLSLDKEILARYQCHILTVYELWSGTRVCNDNDNGPRSMYRNNLSFTRINALDRCTRPLISTTYISKLDDLDKANQYGNWYWTIRQLRNYSLGNSLIS